MPGRSRADYAGLRHLSLGDAMDAIAELIGTDAKRVASGVPAVAALLEMVQAAQAIADNRADGFTKELAIGLAADEIGIPPDTLRSRIRNWRRAATGNAPEKRVKVDRAQAA